MRTTASLRVQVAEVSQIFERAIEDADDGELVAIVERVAWAVLSAARAERTRHILSEDRATLPVTCSIWNTSWHGLARLPKPQTPGAQNCAPAKPKDNRHAHI